MGAGKNGLIVESFGTEMQPGNDTRFTPAPPRRSDIGASHNRFVQIRLAAVLVLVLIAGLVAWLVIGGGSSKSSKTTTAVVSEQGLQKLAAALNGPVYWVGPQVGARYEVEQRSGGQIYLRYLSGQMKPGTIATLTVGTYPMQNAYAATVAIAKKNGWAQLATGSGGVTAFVNSTHPLSVYFAIPGLNDQIEVYDPKPGRAAVLVQAGRVLPVTQGVRLGLTLAGLKKQVASLGQPVYWTGPEPGVTYEYTRDPGGNIELRYLPAGVAVGSSDVYPTVGTYPMPNALATTKAAGARSGGVPVTLKGAAAFYSASKPTSVYVAFKGSNYQVEVYNPVAALALEAVASGQVKPID